MALKSIYKRRRNPMNGMGPLPNGMPSMSQGQSPSMRSQFPRQRYRPLAPQPRQHTTYNLAVPGRKLKQRGRAIIDANPYKTSLKALQRGTNVPIRLIGGEVRGHGGSRYSRQRKAYYDNLNREAAAKANAPKVVRDKEGNIMDDDPANIKRRRQEKLEDIKRRIEENKGLDWLDDGGPSLGLSWLNRNID